MRLPSSPVRSFDDLAATARSLAYHFGTDTVVVVGSQAVLVGWPEAPVMMRTTPEIDAYPANARIWERERNASAAEACDRVEASEEINALFGEGSSFHVEKGFYIDGVDDRTARLPVGWQARAAYAEVPGHRGPVTIVAPCLADVVVSKLHRFAEKDRDFVGALQAARPMDLDDVGDRLGTCEPPPDPALAARVRAFLASLPARSLADDGILAPESPTHPPGSHRCFVEVGGRIVVRAWDADLSVFRVIDNPMGPAVVPTAGGPPEYRLAGALIEKNAWAASPRVEAACQGRLSEPSPPWASDDADMVPFSAQPV